jgi:hypothetical protein
MKELFVERVHGDESAIEQVMTKVSSFIMRHTLVFLATRSSATSTTFKPGTNTKKLPIKL